MTAQPITRKRLHDYIDAMPDYGLPIVEPILAHFADEPLSIETDLTAEEKADIAEGRKLRREHPEEFISLDQFLTHGGYLIIKTVWQWEAFTERAAIMEIDGGLARRVATLRAFEICFPGDYRECMRIAAQYQDGETALYEYLKEVLIKPQYARESPLLNEYCHERNIRQSPENPLIAQKTWKGIEAIQYIMSNGIPIKDFYDVSQDGVKESYSLTTTVKAGHKYKAFIQGRFLCLDLDVKNNKNGIISLDRLLTAWGKPQEKRPDPLRNIPESFPCYTQTPNEGVHLYFKYRGPLPDGKTFSKDYPGIDIMATQITAPGSYIVKKTESLMFCMATLTRPRPYIPSLLRNYPEQSMNQENIYP